MKRAKDFGSMELARAPTVLAKTIKYRECDEHMLRRLASAMLLHWDAVPDALQDLIIDQAAAVEDRSLDAHQSSDIEAFVRKVKAVNMAPVEIPVVSPSNAAIQSR